jgi:CheY-like chemotaxis protein
MDKQKIFKEHVLKTEVLVVDKNPSSRTRLLKIMYDLGCNRKMIHTAGSLQEAEAILEEVEIGIVLSDYFIQGGSGFDLFKCIREKNPNNKHLTTILVTSNISQTAVAKAAEEDVDSFIIKPYTIQSIQENLISTVANKVQPSMYIQKIEEGKVHLDNEEYEEAIGFFQEATKLHSKPALALSYIGQAEYLQELAEKAKDSYTSGLKFNNIHYKCLIGLYEMFKEREEWQEAYQVVKKIAKFFPANPDRMGEIIRLAVRTGNFEDLQMYYEIFTSIEERTDGMVKHIGAGLYVGGKHFLMHDQKEEALKYFDQVAISCSMHTRFLRAIIGALVKFQLIEEAEKYLTRFGSETKETPDFQVSEFLVMSGKDTPPAELVKFGLDVYNQNIRDPECLEIMIKCMQKCGYKKEMIAEFRQELRHMETAA